MTLTFKVLTDKKDDFNSRACLNFTQKTWYLYAYSYADAAKALAKEVINTGRHQDTRIYPIIYLYRHSVELFLKLNVRQCQKLLIETPETNEKTLDGHDLRKLWNELKNKLSYIQPNPAPEFSYIDEIVHDFSILDQICKYSERYPEGKSAESKSFEGISHLSISNISSHFDKAIEFFDCISTWLSEIYDNMMEGMSNNS